MARAIYLSSSSSSSSSEDDDDEILAYMQHLNRPRRLYTVRERRNHMEYWDDHDFFARFRLTKHTVWTILALIEDNLQTLTNRNHAVPPLHQLLLTLRFYAFGAMLVAVGDFAGIHKTTACIIVHKVSTCIASLSHTYIKFPEQEEEVRKTQREFYEIARFPRVVGAMDCTHVRIQSPGGDRAEYFRNRKGYFSLNVQTVSDANLKILDIVASWPGSSHDTTIFNSSALRARFESGIMRDSLLLVDAGYDSRSYLMVPVPEPNNRAEELYNESHKRTRNVVERKYGVWKRRFPILSLGLRVKLERAMTIIVATAVLHNFACLENEEEPPVDPELDININTMNDIDIPNIPAVALRRNATNDQVRQSLILNYFARL